jgi:hypothetical protein
VFVDDCYKQIAPMGLGVCSLIIDTTNPDFSVKQLGYFLSTSGATRL